MRRYDIILMDMDDTLFDFRRSEREALRKSMLSRGLEPTAERLTRYREISEELWRGFDRGEYSSEWLTVERFARFARELGYEADPAAWNREHAAAIGEECWPMPGAEELCRDLYSAGCRLYIATNGMGISQRRRLALSPMAPLITDLFVSHEMGVRKPDLAYFQAVFQRLGQPDRSRVVMLGDGLRSDILGALRAGIDSVWFCPEILPGDDSIRPTYTVRTLAEAEAILLPR